MTRRAAFLAFDGDRVVVGTGQAVVLDPARPSSLLDVATMARSPLAAAKFVGRNLDELAGAARDALTGKLGSPVPPHRVLLSIEPTSVAVLDPTGIAESYGWDPAEQRASEPSVDVADDKSIDLSELPDDLAALASDGTAALGWSTGDGDPLVLPAAWERDRSRARVSRGLFELCGAASTSPAALTMDAWTGYGPTGKQGLMLRGRGTAGDDAADVAIDLDLERATYWDGVDTATATL